MQLPFKKLLLRSVHAESHSKDFTWTEVTQSLTITGRIRCWHPFVKDQKILNDEGDLFPETVTVLTEWGIRKMIS